MKAISAYKTDIGRERSKNQDHIWLDDTAGIYIVADGVGGKKAGEVASVMASTQAGQLIMNQLNSSWNDPAQIKKLLTSTLEIVSQTIHQTGQADPNLYEMQTTLMALLLRPPYGYICHAGDTRAYHLTNAEIKPLTTDDVWFVGGKLRNLLTKAIGQADQLEPEFVELTVSPGDWLLLCSDGLWDMVDDATILGHVQASTTPTECVETLINVANDAGGKDNISVIAIKIVAN